MILAGAPAVLSRKAPRMALPSEPALLPEAARVRFRRALALLVMTLVLPGSAQLVLGRKDVGRIAIRVWLACVCGLLGVVVVGLLSRSFVFWLGSNTALLGLLRI